MARVLVDDDDPRLTSNKTQPAPEAKASPASPDIPWPKQVPPVEPVTPAGTDDRGPEWDRAADVIRDKVPRKETQSLRAKILQKSIYLAAARGALKADLPQTATTIAVCSKPLSQALDRSAKKNAAINRIVSLVEGTQSDTAMLIGLHACIASAFVLESGMVQRVIERNSWLQAHPGAQMTIAGALASMMTLPEKFLVRADIESEDLERMAGTLLEEAANRMQDQAAAAMAAQAEHARYQASE